MTPEQVPRERAGLHNSVLSAPDSGSVSVIVPVHNEQGNVAPLCGEILAALEGRDFEVVFVDDGSGDATSSELEKLAEAHHAVSVLQLARNFGQSAAIAAGLAETTGGVVVTIDGDMQNDPADIPALLSKLEEGYDVVSGWRRRRKEPFLMRRLPSMAANRLIDWATGAGVHDNGCGLKAYRRELFQHIQLYGEGHRIILAQAAQMGARIGEVEVSDRPRAFGRSKYGLSRTYKVLLDLLALTFLSAYAFKPIRVFGGIGFTFLFSAFAIALGLVVWRFTGGGYIIQSPLLLLSGVLLIVGVNLVLLGLLAELLVRVYHEQRGGPVYAVRRRVGGKNGSRGG